MEVSAVQNTSYQQLNAVQDKKGPAESRADNTQSRNQEEIRKDEYVKGGPGQETSAGIYHVTQDANGDRKVQYEDPEKPVEECTMNTDRVDREIAKLKEEKQRLQQEIRSASGDEEAVRKLERQLANVRNELLQKDNDTYRRQHADVS